MKLAVASVILAQTAQATQGKDVTSRAPLIERLRRLDEFSSSDQPKKMDLKDLRIKREIFTHDNGLSTSFRRDSIFTGILKNLERLQRNVECNPSLKDDADVGVLSCGVGRYCAESADSMMGGFCLTDDKFGGSRRGLQGNTIISELQYACDYGYLINYDCTCNLDADAYSGSTTCTSPSVCSASISACNVNTTGCRSDSYTVIVQGMGSWDAEVCVEYTAPYNQKICYSLMMVDYGQNVSPDCTINFEGNACSSCQAYAKFDSTGQNNETYPAEICYVFDCTNTASGMTGNTCELPVSTMTLYLDTFGCPACDLCGSNGTMMSPATSVQVLNNTYQCGYIHEVSAMGFFTEASCLYFSSVVQGPCQCENRAEIPEEPVDIYFNETDFPTEEFTMEPSNDTAVPLPTEVCEVCPNGAIVNPDGLLSVPGQTSQISCNELARAGSDGSIPVDVCPAVQDLAAVPCCGKEEATLEPEAGDFLGEPCNPCGPDREMTKVDGIVSIPMQGMFSCQELSIMGRVAEEDEDWCVLIRPFVQTPCGCQSTVPTSSPTAGSPMVEIDVANLVDSASSSLSGWILVAAGVSSVLLSFLL
ncbi:hypothetical protein IV203_026061 [Nitzschia inconspicua]|uniref:Uncharacterized protein n=1 Tax=Nitzschia inconspicua TaxID=303405 RepID=A0A9K3LLL9_9STRA|nr:hypothetical protein IV203_026061 [Nitzschia inconspicua]